MNKQEQPFWATLRYNPLNMNNILEIPFWGGYIAAALGWLAAFIMPIAPFLIFTVVLVLCDLYTGVRAARKRGDKILSRGFRRTVEKITLYFIAILLTSGMKHVFMPKVPLEYVVAFTIALTELKSNLENIEVLTGVNIWAKVIDMIRQKSSTKPGN